MAPVSEQITLKGMAAVQFKKFVLRFGFHSLGDHFQP